MELRCNAQFAGGFLRQSVSRDCVDRKKEHSVDAASQRKAIQRSIHLGSLLERALQVLSGFFRYQLILFRCSRYIFHPAAPKSANARPRCKASTQVT
jgi:hypothetical protein